MEYKICCAAVKAQAKASAVYVLDGKEYTVNIDSVSSRSYSEHTPFGLAEVKTYTGNMNGVTLKIEQKSPADGRFMLIKGCVTNGTGHDIKLKDFILLESNTVAWPDKATVTPLLEMKDAVCIPSGSEIPSYTDAVAVYPPDGSGAVIGTAGTGTAYLRISVGEKYLKIVSSMEGVTVSPGEMRISEETVILCGESVQCVNEWALIIGRQSNARVHREVMDGWCSWYDRTTNIDEDYIRKIIAEFRDNPNNLKAKVIQIDDGYQKCDGEWVANEKFPSGMDAIAKDISDMGSIPGKWVAPLLVSTTHPQINELSPAFQKNESDNAPNIMTGNPFHPLGGYWLDPTHPIAQKFLANIMEQTAAQGFRYIKIDFNGIGNIYWNKKKTSYEAYRDMYALYRKHIGEGMYLLACIGSPFRAVVGACDACRIGPDSHPGGLRDAMRYLMRMQYANGVWFSNDPDVTYLAKMIDGRMLWEIDGGDEMLRTWHTAIGLSGGTAMTSESVFLPEARQNIRMYEIITPPVHEKARVYDFCRSGSIGRFGFTARRPYGDYAVVQLWNDEDKPTTREIDLKTLELPECSSVVYSFWDNKVLGNIEEHYTTEELAVNCGKLLRITPITGKAQVVGSNLHISCGAAEITNVEADERHITVTLSDAGAREGSIFLLLPYECASVKGTGLNSELKPHANQIFELSISERIRGTENKIEILFKA